MYMGYVKHKYIEEEEAMARVLAQYPEAQFMTRKVTMAVVDGEPIAIIGD